MSQFSTIQYEPLASLATDGELERWLAYASEPDGRRYLVIIERIPRTVSDDGQLLRAAYQETQRAATLNHPSLATARDIFEREDGYYVALDFAPGESIDFVWRSFAAGGEDIPLALTARVVAEAAAALDFARRKTSSAGEPLIHGHLSPSSLVLGYDGKTKLIGHGTAAIHRGVARARGGLGGSNLHYCAPEQFKGGEVDPRTDMFALGVILWEMLTGQRLYVRSGPYEVMRAVCDEPVPKPSAVSAAVPSRLDPIVQRALAKEPSRRYADYGEFLGALEGILQLPGVADQSMRLGALLRERFTRRAQKWQQVAQAEQQADFQRASYLVRELEQDTHRTPTPVPGSDDTVTDVVLGETTSQDDTQPREALGSGSDDPTQVNRLSRPLDEGDPEDTLLTEVPDEIWREASQTDEIDPQGTTLGLGSAGPETQEMEAKADVSGESALLDDATLPFQQHNPKPRRGGQGGGERRRGTELGMPLSPGADDADQDETRPRSVPEPEPEPRTPFLGGVSEAELDDALFGESEAQADSSPPQAERRQWDPDAEPGQWQAAPEPQAQQPEPKPKQPEQPQPKQPAEQQPAQQQPAQQQAPKPEPDQKQAPQPEPQDPQAGSSEPVRPSVSLGAGFDELDWSAAFGQFDEDDDEEEPFEEPFDIDEILEPPQRRLPSRDDRASHSVMEIVRHADGRVLAVHTLEGLWRRYREPESPFSAKFSRGTGKVELEEDVHGWLKRKNDGDAHRELPDSSFELKPGDECELYHGNVHYRVRVFRPPLPPMRNRPQVTRETFSVYAVALALAAVAHVGALLGVMAIDAIGVQMTVSEKPKQDEIFAEGKLDKPDKPEKPKKPDKPKPLPPTKPKPKPVDPTEQKVKIPKTIKDKLAKRVSKKVASKTGSASKSDTENVLEMLKSPNPGEGSSVKEVVSNIDAVKKPGGSSGGFKVGGTIASLKGDKVNMAIGGGGKLGKLGGKKVGDKVGKLAKRKKSGKVRGKVRGIKALTKVQGSLSRSDVYKTIDRYQGQILGCYERRLLDKPGLSGKVVFTWTIKTNGRVRSARQRSSTVADAKVSNCVLGIIKRMKFPRPKGGEVEISYPFMFQQR